MQPADLHRTIARATGDSLATIQRLGFELVDPRGSCVFESDDPHHRLLDPAAISSPEASPVHD